jgi:hypothetical protein
VSSGKVVWPNKFMPGSFNMYDGSSNPEEFIQIYHTVIEAAVGDGQVVKVILQHFHQTTTRIAHYGLLMEGLRLSYARVG